MEKIRRENPFKTKISLRRRARKAHAILLKEFDQLRDGSILAGNRIAQVLYETPFIDTRRSAKFHCGSFTLGLSPMNNVSEGSKYYPELTAFLSKIARRKFPGFTFTSIQVNKNWRGDMHVDSMNCGPSLMYTCGGDSSARTTSAGGVGGGGDLLVIKPATILSHQRYVVEGPDLIKYECKRYKTKNNWICFDGNFPHATFPYNIFDGLPRFSIVYFTLNFPKKRTVPPDVKGILCTKLSVYFPIVFPKKTSGWPKYEGIAKQIIKAYFPELDRHLESLLTSRTLLKEVTQPLGFAATPRTATRRGGA